MSTSDILKSETDLRIIWRMLQSIPLRPLLDELERMYNSGDYTLQDFQQQPVLLDVADLRMLVFAALQFRRAMNQSALPGARFQVQCACGKRFESLTSQCGCPDCGVQIRVEWGFK